MLKRSSMRLTKACFTSQLDLYRTKNLQYARDAGYRYSEFDLQGVCQAVVDAIKAVRRTVGHVDVAEYRKALTSVGANAKNDLFRNTSLDDMTATKFDIERAMKSFNKFKEIKRGGSFASERKEGYATLARDLDATATRVSHSTDVSHIRASRSYRDFKLTCNLKRRQFSTDIDAKRKMNQTALPADRFSRAATVAGLMLNMASTAAKEVVQRYMQGERGNIIRESITSEDNLKLLVDCLCKMRGTALKFGQLLSLQYGILPENIRKALISVRHRADVMSEEDVKRIMTKELGNNWKTMFKEFEFHPMASASLGQVHNAVTNDGRHVCVKLQFPGIADSIDSDISNILFICTKTNLIPKNVFLKHFASELKVELTSECDYHNEANFYKVFKQLTLDGFVVPEVIDELSTQRVITTEFVPGVTQVPVEECKHLPQQIRDSIGERLLRLALSEIFVFGLMNTDPNPSNYLYDRTTDLIGLIDFGSCRSYHQKFVNEYYQLVTASVNQNIEQIRELSYKMKFLNDQDSEEMVKHHVESVLITGEPFRYNGRFDFGTTNIIQQCRDKASIILKIRKQPPPPEVYSLHRKLAGCYVICQLLRARVDAHEIFKEIAAIR